MRGLTQNFLEDLHAGLLHCLLERVRLDATLCLELRNEYLNIYYRGGNLLRVGSTPGGAYQAFFDRKYAKGAELDLPGAAIRTEADARSWLDAFPALKLTMDLWFGRHPKEEREVQQLIARANNTGSMARQTDFYVCDIEYANPHGRFDVVGVHWPSTSHDRMKSAGRRLMLGEVKYGDGALTGKAGLHDHVRDVDRFLADPEYRRTLEEEMVAVFNQKRALGLLDCGRDLEGFSTEAPLFLLILADHDPGSTKLREALGTLPACENAEVRIVTGSLLGYGMFDPAILTVEEALDRHGACI